MQSIMLVDDSTTILMSVEAVLSEAGYAVDSAQNGLEALDKLKGGLNPDLIITDLNMPVMDGLEFIREARTLGPTRFTPILMLTTEWQDEMRDKGKEAGATGWLVKPVDGEELLDVVMEVVPA